ncbi:MAG: hypothetical protein GX890_06455 [Firmicutes bacterium]|jgi:uncharacterized membrane protein YobD (UPF0266 family)|nr:hypothetical protein [Bacillota bacterium]HPU01666.1 hypothetical protein [Bacillota bacterium]
MKALFGMMAALALLAVGLYFLPPPASGSTGTFFAALWLLAAAISAIAFGRELLLLRQLNAIRRRWRLAARKRRYRPARAFTRLAPLRERERHLD